MSTLLHMMKRHFMFLHSKTKYCCENSFAVCLLKSKQIGKIFNLMVNKYSPKGCSDRSKKNPYSQNGIETCSMQINICKSLYLTCYKRIKI